jgi:hypothetical protein
MKRLLVLTLGGVLSVAAAAQQPGPEGQNNNQNSPLVNHPATAPTNTPTTSPASRPAGAGSSTNTNPGGATTTLGTPSGTTASQPPAASGSAAPPNAVPGNQPGNQPAQPTTEMIPQGNALPSADPVLEPKELPKADLSLIGGTALKIDTIRNRVEIQPFGSGKRLDLRFDDRSHIYRDGRETTVLGINKGDKIYADTMLVNGHIFARNLRVVTTSAPAESRGQVTAYDPKTGRVNLQDSLTGQTVTFFVTNKTAMNKRGSMAAAPADLKPGALLDVMFAPGRHGGTADQISILAAPGEDFIFSGKVTNLDLSRGVLAVDNESDDKNYEVHFDPANLDDRDALRVGTQITARAQFDGKVYHANQVTVMKGERAQQ